MTWNVVHISEADAISNFASVLAQVRAGAEVVIECEAHAVAVVCPARDEDRPRLLSESIALAIAKKHAEETGCEPTLDADFVANLEAVIKSRRT
jgi:antitoxin (DNA-binding transcriptional repressor) of toxin-antitoxin stability system